MGYNHVLVMLQSLKIPLFLESAPLLAIATRYSLQKHSSLHPTPLCLLRTSNAGLLRSSSSGQCQTKPGT
jgi:hypothetical protein